MYGTVPLKLNKGDFMQLMTTFHLSLVDTIRAATLLPTRYVLTINETFQMRYCTKFYLIGHPISTSQSQRYQKRPTLLTLIRPRGGGIKTRPV